MFWMLRGTTEGKDGFRFLCTSRDVLLQGNREHPISLPSRSGTLNIQTEKRWTQAMGNLWECED